MLVGSNRRTWSTGRPRWPRPPRHRRWRRPRSGGRGRFDQGRPARTPGGSGPRPGPERSSGAPIDRAEGVGDVDHRDDGLGAGGQGLDHPIDHLSRPPGAGRHRGPGRGSHRLGDGGQTRLRTEADRVDAAEHDLRATDEPGRGAEPSSAEPTTTTTLGPAPGAHQSARSTTRRPPELEASCFGPAEARRRCRRPPQRPISPCPGSIPAVTATGRTGEADRSGGTVISSEARFGWTIRPSDRLPFDRPMVSRHRTPAIGVVLFRDLDDSALAELASTASDPRQLQRGDVLFTENDEPTELFVVVSGRPGHGQSLHRWPGVGRCPDGTG